MLSTGKILHQIKYLSVNFLPLSLKIWEEKQSSFYDRHQYSGCYRLWLFSLLRISILWNGKGVLLVCNHLHQKPNHPCYLHWFLGPFFRLALICPSLKLPVAFLQVFLRLLPWYLHWFSGLFFRMIVSCPSLTLSSVFFLFIYLLVGQCKIFIDKAISG